MAATRDGLSAAGYGHARHRAAKPPALWAPTPSRPAHLRRHSRLWLGLIAVLLLAVGTVAWRLSDTALEGDAASRAAGSAVSRSVVDINASGDVHVVTELHFAAPVDSLTVRVPRETWAVGAFDPTVTGISLDLAGFEVTLGDPLTAGQSRSVPLASGVDRVRLEYDATGTFVASTPSAPGRGLVLLTPLVVVEQEALFQLEVVDERVLNLGCVGAGELTACGTRSGQSWVASPVAEARAVLAQVDLETR